MKKRYIIGIVRNENDGRKYLLHSIFKSVQNINRNIYRDLRLCQEMLCFIKSKANETVNTHS